MGNERSPNKSDVMREKEFFPIGKACVHNSLERGGKCQLDRGPGLSGMSPGKTAIMYNNYDYTIDGYQQSPGKLIDIISNKLAISDPKEQKVKKIIDEMGPADFDKLTSKEL